MGSGAGKKKATRQYKNIQATILLADYSTRPGLGILMWVWICRENIRPGAAPKELMSFSVRLWRRNPCSIRTTQTPEPPGCWRKPYYSPRFCPSSSALLCGRFSVRSFTESPADDWLPGAPHWHHSLILPSNRNRLWAKRAGSPGVTTYRQQVEAWCDFCYRYILKQVNAWGDTFRLV